jgi:hypothetical protein
MIALTVGLAVVPFHLGFVQTAETRFAYAGSFLLAAVVHCVLRVHLGGLSLWPKSGLLLRVSAAITILCFGSIALVLCSEYVSWFSQLLAQIVDVVGEIKSTKDSDPVAAHVALSLPAIALMISLLAIVLCNVVVTPEAGAICRALGKNSSPLQVLLTKSLLHKGLVEVTLKSGMVHIGWVTGEPPTVESANSQFLLLPAMSGYRDSTSRQIVIKFSYISVYRSLGLEQRDSSTRKHKKRLLQSDDYFKFHRRLALVIPIEEVQVASRFDGKMFSRHGKVKLQVGVPRRKSRKSGSLAA